MTRLQDLKHKRAELIRAKRDHAKSLLVKADALDDADEIPVEDMDRLSQMEADIAALDKRIEQLELLMQAEGDDAQPIEEEEDTEKRAANSRRALPNINRIAASVKRTPIKAEKAALFVMGAAIARTKGWAAAAECIKSIWGDSDVHKALNTAGTGTGGALIPQAFLPELIELLRAEVVIRQAEPMVIPMPYGQLTIPRLAASAQAGYQGELDDITVSQETFDDLQLNAKKLTAMVPISNDLIRRAAIGMEETVRNDLVDTIARREDIAFLRGDGSGGSPIGLLNLCAAANKLTAVAVPSTGNADVVTYVNGVLQGMVLALENGMARMIRPTWFMAPTAKEFIRGLRDNVGSYVFRDEMNGGKLWGYPFFYSQQIPTNLMTAAGNANGSEIYFVDMADMVLAETMNVSIDASDVATYKDSGGNVVSAFQRDQSLIRVIEEHDFNTRHQASIAVGLIPAWGPPGFNGWSGGSSYFVQAPSGDGSAAASTFGTPPTGSNNPANVSANVPGGLLPGRA